MRLHELDYELPDELIAQTPIEPRDAARLLVVDRATQTLAHRRFGDLAELLKPGDLVVANDSRVLAARLEGRKESGGVVEVLALRAIDEHEWEALVRGRVRAGSRIVFGAGSDEPVSATVVALESDGLRRVRFDRPAIEVMSAHGVMPVPPYVHEPVTDAERYQTVYSRLAGSAAAPTAGLHFTTELIARLAKGGIGFAFVTLHVGVDTFRPVTTEAVAEHRMHAEWFDVPRATIDEMLRRRSAGGRIVAVGTTSVRALEASAYPGGAGATGATGWTELFILPGYRFQICDALITNFHLPRSTLIALVSAFGGTELIRCAYDEAIRERYRFYSFGDAMLIL